MDDLNLTLPVDDTDLDPVDVILRFVQRIESMRIERNPWPLDRERLLITIILALLSDPHHLVGKRITRPLLQCYLDRGGRLNKPGVLARAMRDPDQFEHTIRYLHDYGMGVRNISEAMGVSMNTVRRFIHQPVKSNEGEE